MHIQQIRHVRHEITGSDGKVRTVADIEPVTDAEMLNHGGKNYPSLGNGVFKVPDELGRSLLGGAFREVGPGLPVEKARVNLVEHHLASEPSISQVAAQERINAATEAPEAKRAPRKARGAKKA